MKTWYKFLWILWLLVALPVLIIGYGFSGGRLELPEWQIYGIVDIVAWGVGWLLMLAPVWAAPFGICWRTARRSSPTDDGGHDTNE